MKLPAIFVLLFLACTFPALSQEVLITDVNVINVRNGQISEGQHVLIKDGIITTISKDANSSAGATVIDGSGYFLLPGLAEMHAHIPSSDWGRKNAEETLFLYLSNGVTTIRGMLGHPEHLILRQQAASNDILSPRIITSSPSLNGNTIPSAEEARKKVLEYSAAGYDFLKIHPGIKRDVFDVMAKTAKEAGIPFAGHVPVDVGIVHALESGYATVDHVDGYLEGLVPASAGKEPDQNGFFGYNFTYLADTGNIERLVELTSKQNVWIVPTQSLFERWFSPESAEKFLSEPEMKYMPASILKNWETSKNNLMKDPSFNSEQWEAFNTIRRKLIYALKEGGPGLLLGSDAPQVFNVPGFSIHHEMEAMRKAGLTPLEIIQAGTLNPATYLGKSGEFGEIIPGASADMILVDGNPLNDISALKQPAYVIVRGNVLTRNDIDERLAAIASKALNE